MQKLIIRGGAPFRRSPRFRGEKRCPPHSMCVSAHPETLTIDNVPYLNDVTTMLSLLRQMGINITVDGKRAELTAAHLSCLVAPYEMVKTMRAAILVWGPCSRARRGQGIPAGWLCDRFKAGRSAHQGLAGDGCGDRHRAWLHSRQSKTFERRTYRHGYRHRYRYRKSDDGGDTGRRERYWKMRHANRKYRIWQTASFQWEQKLAAWVPTS